VNTEKYPLLQEVARDLLAVLVTSGALESAFSFGGRMLDPTRVGFILELLRHSCAPVHG
ncbi:Putative AC transposase, partial [Linum grandiflorum]